jgi:hypothetical protein
MWITMAQPTYYANINQRAPVKYDDAPGSIAVLKSPDNYILTGIAHGRTWDQRGLVVWELM